ncbi:MAG TPA: methylated-DNA--[protein]-cysteine S-methyltransferase [Isosphaeraceae bacterium]|jgi:methylated-DNA-[protein]-cysteine S-methyltransferase|nr:methylated-DNA--[protein]-cysteine S-methyltransferase [Isosphaeraceae bacterium]
MKAQRVDYTIVESPVGDLRLTSDGLGLTSLYMESQKGKLEPEPHWRRDDAAFERVRRQLRAYFAGDLQDFDLPLSLRGTEFQKRVWEALCAIPFGETISYAELARRIEAPRAVRAVGAAVGRNRIGIIVPCHRVIGSGGALTGYAAGLDRKRWLLSHEQAVRSPLNFTLESRPSPAKLIPNAVSGA